MIKKNGMTLIELITVIAVIGILSIVAIPKILDLSHEARKSTLVNAFSSLKASSDMVYQKAIIESKEHLPPFEQYNPVESWIVLNDRTVYLSYGHMLANKWNIETVAHFPPQDWKLLQVGSGHFSTVFIVLRKTPNIKDFSNINQIISSKCYISYGFEREKYTPSYNIFTSGC